MADERVEAGGEEEVLGGKVGGDGSAGMPSRSAEAEGAVRARQAVPQC